MDDISNYKKLRENSLDYYNSLGSVFSPALNTKVSFPSESFNHIIYKSARLEREKLSQILRFKLLPLAHKLVKLSTTYQEFEETIREVWIKRHKTKIKATQSVKYWSLIAIIDNRKIKVILRKVGENGSLHFWSVVPDWVTSKYRDIKLFNTMKGNPEED